jgi:hypothetical protein
MIYKKYRERKNKGKKIKFIEENILR